MLQKELNAQKEELNDKAERTSTDLESLNKKIQDTKAEKAAKAAQAAQAARAAQEAKAAEEAAQEASIQQGGGAGNANNAWAPSGGSYSYPSGPGQLNPRVGVVYYNGHRETYYSQRVLPGGGLNIPGRHIAGDGTIRDENGYLCLASSDHARGTIVQTSLGPGIVYDSGCASGTIDIYTDW